MLRSIFFLFTASLCFAAEAYSQKQNQLLLLGFDYHDQAVYFCNGKRLNEINTKLVAINLLYETDRDFVVDSIRSELELGPFDRHMGWDSLQLAQFAIISGPYYAPEKLGIDTAIITGFYGPYKSQSRIIAHARDLVSPLLYGYSSTRYAFGGNGVHLTNYVLRDTLLDYLRLAPYRVTTEPQETGYNKAIVIRSCKGATVDSVKLESDFSEFTFHNLPTPGQSIPDSFAVTYDFVPHIVGDHLRPISFKLSDGRWLTWIFEYRVRPAANVDVAASQAEGLKLVMAGAREVVVTSKHAIAKLEVIDLSGVARREFNFELSNEVRLDLRGLSAGIYFLRDPSCDQLVKLLLK